MSQLIIHRSRDAAITYSGIMARAIRSKKLIVPRWWKGPQSFYIEQGVLYASPSLVQSTGGTSTSNNPTYSFGSNVTAGSMLAVGCGGANLIPYSSVTDALNGTYNKDVSNATNAASNIFTFPNSAAGAVTVTVHVTASGDTTGAILEEWGGIATSTPLDQTATGSGSSTSATTAASSATSQAIELVLCAMGTVSSRGYTAGSGFTEDPFGQANGFFAMEYLITSSIGAQTGTWTIGGGGSTYGAALATYKASTGVAQAGPLPQQYYVMP